MPQLALAGDACWRGVSPARRIACCGSRFYASVLALALRALSAQRTVSLCAVLDARAHRSGVLSSPTARCGRSHRAHNQFKVGSLRVRDGCVLRPQRATVLAPSGVPTRRALQRSIDSISGYDDFITTDLSGKRLVLFRTVTVPWY